MAVLHHGKLGGAGLLLAGFLAACSSDITLNVLIPEDSDFIAVAGVSAGGETEYSPVRPVASGLLFDRHPSDYAEVRILSWRQVDLQGLSIDEGEPLAPAEFDDDPLPQGDAFRVGDDGALQPLKTSDRTTAAWWRSRPDPCRGLASNEFRADLTVSSVLETSSYQPVRQLLIGVPNEPPGTLAAAAHEAGPVVTKRRSVGTTVPSVDVAFAGGDPWFLLLEDGRLWRFAGRPMGDTVTSTQTLGPGRLEEGIDGSAIFVGDDGQVRRLAANDAPAWTQLPPGAAGDVAYQGPNQLAAIVDGTVFSWLDEQWRMLGAADADSHIAFIDDGLAVSRSQGFDVYFNDGALRSEQLAVKPVEVTRLLDGLVLLTGTRGVFVWRPGRGLCSLDLVRGDYRRASTFLNGANVNFFSQIRDGSDDYFGGSVALDGG